jgi:hypothetical protein
MDELLEETLPMQPKKAVVMLGRMNPPTVGHYMVINSMKKYIREHKDVTPFIVVIAGKETSKDLSKNPLSAEDRLKFIKASGKADGIQMFEAGSVFAAFEKLRELGYEPYAVAAGSDRAKKYIELLDKYFTDDGKKLPHEIVPGLKEREDPDDEGTPSEEILKLAEDGEDIPLFMISGSMARLAVKLGYKVAFSKIVGLPQKLSDMMFAKVQRALGVANE